MSAQQTYKVVSVEKNNEKRYIIVDIKTNKVLDNAQGYGYKTRIGAHKAWGYKNRTPKQIQKENRLKKWIKDHRTICKAYNNACFCAFNDDEVILLDDVIGILKEHDAHENTEFTPQEIWRGLKKYGL